MPAVQRITSAPPLDRSLIDDHLRDELLQKSLFSLTF
jgi:hypothetical protein